MMLTFHRHSDLLSSLGVIALNEPQSPIKQLVQEINELERQLNELKRNVPMHSASVSQLVRIEELEEELTAKKAKLASLRT